jgi:linoleoyl-CoA desaturase
VATGLFLGGTLILNHTHSDLFLENDAKNNRFYHWSVLNAENSANWSSGSVFWNFLSVGLNHHIEHHLFPSMHPYYYPKIAPIVKQTCEQFEVRYNDVGNAYQAICSVARFLYHAGRGTLAI